MSDVRDFTYRPAAETMVRATVDFFAAEPGLTEILAPYLAAPPSGSVANEAIRWVHDLAKGYLIATADELTITDFDTAAFISIGVVSHFAPRIATIDDPDRRARLIQEVVDLLAGYVGASEPPPAAR